MDETLEFVTGLAREAGRFLLEKYRSGEWDAHLKSDRSVVTSADLTADRLISQAIQQRFPNDRVLSEELRPETLQAGMQPGGAVWVVDPLDGTTNFSLGAPHWGTLIARLEDGEPHTAAACFPVLDELYTARRGAGAWLNGFPLTIQPDHPQRPLTFFACCSRTFRRYRVDLPYKIRILGSAAYTICSVARSQAIIGFESTAKIWDLAAPWLIVREAGGAISVLQDQQPFPLNSAVDYSRRDFAVLAAANQEMAEHGRRRITLKDIQDAAPRPAA
jgi:myo-inositol-1(or 4)-monophosphatase